MTHRRHRPPLAGAVVAALVVLGLLAGPAAAASGELDASFGAGGQVVTDVSPGGGDRARAVAVQPDGKVVVAVQGPFQNEPPFALLRYQHDGRLDSSFGTDGEVSTDFPPEDVTFQPDGKILVAGKGFLVARYLADGSVDTAFGTGGRVISTFPNIRRDFDVDANAEHVAVQPDGKIVASGDKCETLFGTYDRAIAVARYTPDGSPDTTFSTDGLAQVEAGGGNGDPTFCADTLDRNENDKNNGLALQGDGKIVVTIGRGSVVAGNRDFFVARLLASGPSAGDLDTSFGTAGTVSTDIRGDDVARAVAIQNGKIVVAGSATNATGGGFALVRYREDGSLDTSFDGDGKLVTDSGQLGGTSALGRALAVQDDGKLVVAGCTFSCGANSKFALARYQPDGALDRGFGADGTITTSFATGGSFANDLAIDPADQSVLVGGGVHDGGDIDVALARYTAQTADLSLSSSASPDPSRVGAQVSYTLTVTNRGPDVARSVMLSDSLSTRVSYASSETSQGTCSPEPDGRSVSCALGGLAPGASATVRIVVAANRTGTATNSATVSSDATDADASNNSVSASTTIAPASASPPPPSPLPPGPAVSNFGLTSNPFVVGGGRTPTFGVAAKAKRHKQGTTFGYSLSEAASVKIVMSQRLSGRRRGKRCVAPTPRLRKAKKCTRFSVKGTLTRTSHKGANRVAFSGRIGSKALKPGHYQATLTATDAAKNSSRPKTISFTIVKR